MTDAIEQTEIEVECENCGAKTKKNIKWIMDHDQFPCECGTMVVVDPSKYRKEMAKTESTLDGFQGLMEKIGGA